MGCCQERKKQCNEQSHFICYVYGSTYFILNLLLMVLSSSMKCVWKWFHHNLLSWETLQIMLWTFPAYDVHFDCADSSMRLQFFVPIAQVGKTALDLAKENGLRKVVGLLQRWYSPILWHRTTLAVPHASWAMLHYTLCSDDVPGSHWRAQLTLLCSRSGFCINFVLFPTLYCAIRCMAPD